MHLSVWIPYDLKNKINNNWLLISWTLSDPNNWIANCEASLNSWVRGLQFNLTSVTKWQMTLFAFVFMYINMQCFAQGTSTKWLPQWPDINHESVQLYLHLKCKKQQATMAVIFNKLMGMSLTVWM